MDVEIENIFQKVLFLTFLSIAFLIYFSTRSKKSKLVQRPTAVRITHVVFDLDGTSSTLNHVIRKLLTWSLPDTVGVLLGVISLG